MPAPAGKVPIVASVQAALTFLRTEFRALATPLAMGATALALVAALGGGLTQSVPGLMLALLLQGAVLAVIYAAFLGVALKEPGARRGAIFSDGARLWAAMSIIGFFLALVFIVALIPGVIALSAAFAPYEGELTAAQGDPIAMNALAERILAENPAPTLALAALYLVAWFALTSRLYLVAPASVAENAIRTFETWPWTKGAMLRIAAARLLLLGPLSALLFALQSVALQWIQASPPAAPIVLVIMLGFLTATLILLALEAGLSAFLYRGLRP